jgi:hypothetical protein
MRPRIAQVVKPSILGPSQKIRDAITVKIGSRRAHIVPLDILIGETSGEFKCPFPLSHP